MAAEHSLFLNSEPMMTGPAESVLSPLEMFFSTPPAGDLSFPGQLNVAEELASGVPACVGGGPADLSSLINLINTPPAGILLSDGNFGASGYGAVGGGSREDVLAAGGVIDESKTARRQELVVRTTVDGYDVTRVVKGQWTPEEDSLLKEMVDRHGDRKWAVVAQVLPGRVGKQCRERWNNHLRPDIKKNHWTEDEELLLIQWHKKIGNRWAEIARCIPGRSENSIKNHWNATKRSMNAKQRIRKRTNQSKGRTMFEQYIRTVCGTPDAPAPPPPPDNLAYGGLLPPATVMPLGSNLAESSQMGMYLNMPPPENTELGLPMYSVPLGGYNSSYYVHNFPGYPELTYAPYAPAQPPVHDLTSTNCNQNYPFVGNHTNNVEHGKNPIGTDSFVGEASNHVYFGGYGEAGSSSGSCNDELMDLDFAEMISRHFSVPSDDDITLDFNGVF